MYMDLCEVQYLSEPIWTILHTPLSLPTLFVHPSLQSLSLTHTQYELNPYAVISLFLKHVPNTFSDNRYLFSSC